MKLLCPQCKASHLKSFVYVGMSMTTCMGWATYYDEEGRFHSHNPNVTTTEYRCSNGHNWSEDYRSKCWCESTIVPPIL